MNTNLVEKYRSVIDDICKYYKYDSNISHLLYLIIPAFLTYYSKKSENIIINTFRDIPILISPNRSDTIEAYYTSIPKYENNKIITNKYIVLQNYEKISLVQLLDNLIHEFNHAINSRMKEIKYTDDILYLRTGLTYVSYSLPSLKPLEKKESYILEEVLNTRQTEEIINLIKSYHNALDTSIQNIIYSLNHETDSTYTSNSYYLENLLFQKILDNKTFISTLNNLRFSGDVDDIDGWFDNITNMKNSYKDLNNYLRTIMELEQKLITAKFFKFIIINKIKDNITKVLDIIQVFNQNCNYK